MASDNTKEVSSPAQEFPFQPLPVSIDAALFRELVVNGREPFIVNGLGNLHSADDHSKPDYQHPFPVDSHETMQAWAIEYEEHRVLIERFKNALEDPALPATDREYVTHDFNEVLAEFTVIAEIFQTMMHEGAVKVAQISQGAAAIRQFDEHKAMAEELTGVMEAVIGAVEQRVPLQQALSQQILEEILTMFDSTSAHLLSVWKGDTHVDTDDVSDLRVNNNALADIFSGEPWTENDTDGMRGHLKEWQQNSSPYIQEVAGELESLWAAASGKNAAVSVFELLDARRLVLEALQKTKQWNLTAPLRLFPPA